LKKGKRHLDPTEFIEIVRVPMEEAREMIYSGKIVDSKTIVAILAYYDKKSQGIFK
jgi:ADP-ribose pyrophosphatase